MTAEPASNPTTAAPITAGGEPDAAASAARLASARRLAEAGALFTVIVWSANYVVVKAAIASIPPILFACVRFGIAALILFAILRLREGSIGISRRDLPRIAILAFVGFSIYQVLWATALATTTAGNSALIIAATPVITMVISALGGTDTLSRPKVIGATISLAGVAVVIGAGHGIGSISFGDLLTFGAAICWSAYVALGAPVLRRISPLRSSAWMLGIGTLGLVPFAAFQVVGLNIGAIPPAAGVGLLYSALLAGAMGSVLIFHGIAVLGPTRVALFQFLSPAMTLVIGYFALGEPIGPAQVLGGAVIIGGILLARTARSGSAPRALVRSTR